MIDNIQPEKKPLTSKIAKRIERAVFSKWLAFNYFALFSFLIVPPLLSPFGPSAFGIFPILFLFPILSDSVQLSVAERTPTIFLKVERLRHNFQKAFWLLVVFT